METIFKLTPEDMKEEHSALASGEIPVILSLSAYDVPNSFTVTVVGDSLRIDFGYIDREAAEHRSVDDRLTVLLGKNSGKVLGFIVKPDAQRPREITVRIAHGVDEQMSRATRSNQRMNYALIKRIVQRRLETALAER
jgi:hypothetical protein